MKHVLSIVVIAALACTLAACSDKPVEKLEKPKTESSSIGNKVENASLLLEQTAFPATNWKTDGSHHKTVKGTLLLGDKPVVGASVQVSDIRSIDTNEDGGFLLTVDTNAVANKKIYINSLDNATVDGKKLDQKTKEALMKATETIKVHYPIAIDEVKENEEDSSLVDVYAHAVLTDNEQFPRFGIEKFKVGGTIKDADGNPVEGATVNLRRDGVEGFSMSNPSNEDGEFFMYYIPEDDENHYFYVHIPSKDLTYTLPPRKTFLFTDDYGVNIDVILPREGTIIDDKPPTLVATTAPGALLKGVLIGANVTEGSDYSITVPERDGSFVLTLPKEEWEKDPTFYQVNYQDFHLEDLQLGDPFPVDRLRLPTESEPSGIVPSKK